MLNFIPSLQKSNTTQPILEKEENSKILKFSDGMNLNFKLNEDQKDTINTISAFMESKLDTLTVSGSAGCGKTTIIGIVVSYLIHKPYNFVLCAPTHKAKDILHRATEFEVITIHKLLSLKPNVEIEKFNAKDLKFIDKKVTEHMPYKGVIIIDESSMINDELYNLIIKRASEYQSKVIFIGDSAQLQPVKQDDKSKVFNSTDVSCNLTIIERQRQDNPLTAILADLRIKPKSDFINNYTDKGGVIVTKSPRDFLMSFRDDFNISRLQDNPYSSRVLAFTNQRVKQFNNTIRSNLFKFTDQYVIGDLLMAYDNYSDGDTLYMSNSSDYIVLEVEPIDVNLPNFVKLPGFRLELKSLSNEYANTFSIDVISNDLPQYVYDTLAITLDNFREMALANKHHKTVANGYWRKFYALDSSIHSPKELSIGPRLIKKKALDYGYAHTVHKSQGATYDNIHVDMANILSCRDISVLRQLQYVGMSRTKNKVKLLC